MISNATRAFCALLSTIGAAGLVLFACPAAAIGSHHTAPAPVIATVIVAAPAGLATHG